MTTTYPLHTCQLNELGELLKPGTIIWRGVRWARGDTGKGSVLQLAEKNDKTLTQVGEGKDRAWLTRAVMHLFEPEIYNKSKGSQVKILPPSRASRQWIPNPNWTHMIVTRVTSKTIKVKGVEIKTHMIFCRMPDPFHDDTVDNYLAYRNELSAVEDDLPNTNFEQMVDRLVQGPHYKGIRKGSECRRLVHQLGYNGDPKLVRYVHLRY